MLTDVLGWGWRVRGRGCMNQKWFAGRELFFDRLFLLRSFVIVCQMEYVLCGSPVPFPHHDATQRF